MLHELVVRYHAELDDARIALAWNRAWKADVDGRVTLGQCKRVADLERELHDLDAFDFVIILREEFWNDPHVTDQQRRALLDHELCHATVKLDADGEPIVDERSRTVYRTRKHDLEEFSCIAERYGVWKRDLEVFDAALTKAKMRTETWPGYSTVRARLVAAGADVPFDAVVGWTEDQRRDADVWARLVSELQAQGVDIVPAAPAQVSAAMATRYDSEGPVPRLASTSAEA